MVREGQLLAVFNSAHRVMKAEGILKSLGLRVLLIPAPRQLMTDCGLAIRFSPEDRPAVMEALRHNALLPEYISRLDAGEYVTDWQREAGEDERSEE